MDRVEVAQKKADETKSLLESTVKSMTNSMQLVENDLVPNAVSLAIEGEEAKEMAEEVVREERCRTCRAFCFCFACSCCGRRKKGAKY